MALAKEDLKAAYPLPVYNYRVEIGSEAVAFSEVSGLSISVETTTYKESPTSSGVPGPRLMVMPGQLAQPTISLKKGLVPAISIPILYGWINSIQLNQVEKKDIKISLCNEAGDPVVTWIAINAFPTKLDAPSFDANSNDAAIESMDLICDRVTMSAS
ncbi:MAG: phage tail protein [Alteromonadaceae bacterium]|nr:MAG: phage tail protein [Alteromonadaceae bacterium]